MINNYFTLHTLVIVLICNVFLLLFFVKQQDLFDNVAKYNLKFNYLLIIIKYKK